MKYDKILNNLNNSSIKDLVSNQTTSYHIHEILLKELGEDECPSENAIINYIKNQFGLMWNSQKKSWISLKEDDNYEKKGKKKGRKKSSETLTLSNEIEIENNNNLTFDDGNLSININYTNSNLSEKSNTKLGQNSNLLESENKEKSTSNSTENKVTNSAKKGSKKGRKKTDKTFVKIHEIEINDDDSYESKEKDSSPSEKLTTSTSSEKDNTKLGQNIDLLTPKNEEKNTLNSTNNENSITTNQSSKSGKLCNTGKVVSIIEDFSSNPKPESENIDILFYPEYIECCGKEKYSLSLNSFVIKKVEEIILETYNKKKMSKSKIINLALIQFIRFNITDNNKDN